MREQIILILLVAFTLFLTGCTEKIEVTDFDSCAKAGNPIRESYPAQCTHDGKIYVQDISGMENTSPDESGAAGGTHLNFEEYCNSLGGIWLDGYGECEYISIEDCEELDGTFNECESACRHDQDAEVCTMQCVPVCTFN